MNFGTSSLRSPVGGRVSQSDLRAPLSDFTTFISLFISDSPKSQSVKRRTTRESAVSSSLGPLKTVGQGEKKEK